MFLRSKHGETKFFLFRWFNAGMRWLENSYDSFLEFTAHHWWTIVVPSIALLALTYAMLIERPKAFIPVEDQGYLITAIQTPDGTGREATSKVAAAISKIALGLEGVSDVVLLEGFNVLNSTNQTNSATAFVTLKEWGERTRPELRAPALTTKLQAAISKEVRGAVAVVLQPPPIRGLSQTGGFEFMIEDRDGKGVEALALITDRFLEEARKQPELGGLFTPFTVNVPQIRFNLDRVKAQRLGVAVSDVFAVLQTNLGGYYVNDFNLYGKVWKVMVQAEGSRRVTKDDIERLYVLNQQGTAGSPRLAGRRGLRPRPDRCSALQHVQRRQDHRPARRRVIARARRSPRWNGSPTRSCPKASRTNGPAPRFRNRRPATWRCTSSPCRSSACSCSWRPSTRAGSARW